MKVKRLYTYTLKSSRGVTQVKVEVGLDGFKYDRVVSVVDSNSRLITARERPELLSLVSILNKRGFQVGFVDEDQAIFDLPYGSKPETIQLFRNDVLGIPFGTAANKWISNVLGGNFRFFYQNGHSNPIQEKRGGRVGETKSYADSTPIHLINLTTLNYLNQRLNRYVSARNFRPNIVIQTDEPFEEDSWDSISINEIVYRVQERTSRCIMTTIDPITMKKTKTLQPLSELSRIRLARGERPTMGIGLIPASTGVMRTGDNVVVNSKKV